ncbi:MAG: LAGLIDADG family homing endonuclease [Candidatus Pacearchaeota archaeon]
MRLKLKKGKQRELIKEFKDEKRLTWINLADLLGIKYGRLKAYVDETSLIPKSFYEKLDTKKKFSKYIIEEMVEGWGKIKGGKNSGGSTKDISFPRESGSLAEFFGIMLGDGNSHKTAFYNSRKDKRGTYMIRIVGDSRYDKDYLIKYVKPLIRKLFNINVRSGKFKKQNAIYIEAHSRQLIEFLEAKEFKPGNKIKNKLTIPGWILNEETYLKHCLRGLIDTDGSIHKMSNKDPKLIRISFKNHNKTLLKNTKEAFIQIGFNPSKIILNNVFYISRQSEIKKYLKEIGFSNNRHKERLKALRKSPIV